MQRNHLSLSIVLALAGVAAPQAHAQTADAPDTSATRKLDEVTVTGSLIPQAVTETASPVVTITGQEIERQGFSNVYDALRRSPLATGAVQDNQNAGGFTQGATTVSLLGLDPGFTLTLIDGHPIADYPLLYNGQSNFVDLSSIPVGMVDRIDILPGNQSSIYGSSAIAGVINIILKKKMEGIEVNVRAGGYSDGGGNNQRLQVTGGHSWDTLDLVYGLQVTNQSPIWGFQRKFADSTLDNPDPTARFGTRTFLYGTRDPNTGATLYTDPGSAACESLHGQFDNSTEYDFRPGRGNYCGSKAQVGYQTLLNKNRAASGYLNVQDRLSDNALVYGNLLYNVSSQTLSDGSRFWQTGPNTQGFFFNPATGNLETAQRFFSPEEAGGLDVTADRVLTHSYNFYGGVRGGIGSSNWEYDAYYARSQSDVTDKELWPLTAKIDAFFERQFLGPNLGDYYGFPQYSPNPAGLYHSLTPAEYLSIQGLIYSKSRTYTQNVNLQLNDNALFALPAGDVGIAALFQAGNQYWNQPVDPLMASGQFFERTATQGQGKRSNYAGAVEVRVPIVSTLVADVSTRYDSYKNDGGSSDDKLTYKLGLEYRPFESLLLRGNYASAFRAPDLAYSFAGQSGFFTSVTDYYRCATQDPNTPLPDCLYNPANVQGSRRGNPNLSSITAKSFGYGVVWSPLPRLNLKADYYNIKIDNEVTDLSIDQLLRTESACRLGGLDINSPTCQDALSRIVRDPPTSGTPDALETVRVNPINISNEHVAGIVAAFDYTFDVGRYGSLRVGADYNVTLKHEYRQFPTDPLVDVLREPFYSSEFRSVFSGTVTWDIDRWSTTVYGIRYGKTPNYAANANVTGYRTPGGDTISPYMLYNASVTYRVMDDASIGVIVNNVFNTDPPHDKTSSVFYPFYNTSNYNGYGRAYWLEFDMKFGR